MITLAAFSNWDFLVLLGYLGFMVLLGTLASRRKTDAEGYFLAERSMPVWAVSLSVVATSLSVATFMGAPQESFTDNLTYLSLNIGGFLAVFIVAIFFIPRFYRAGTVTIYGFIDKRFGETSRIGVSATFLIGRLIASGVRLFFAAMPVCLLIYSYEPHQLPSRTQLITAIILIGAIGTAYTIAGGIRAVIWTDSAQILIVMGAAMLSIWLLLNRLGMSIPQVIDTLRHSSGYYGGSKLRLIDFSSDPTHKYTFWTALIGGTFLNVAAYGVDHDLAQRMLTAKSPWRGGLSLIASQFLSLFVVSLFMIVGLLLYLYHGRPDEQTMASMVDVYPRFLVKELPAGLSGLAMAGMCAAAQGSLDSAINAMASSAVADLYWPIRRKLGMHVDVGQKAKAPRVAVAAMGAILILFAVGAAFIYDPKQKTLLDFALGVMSFAYAGMLGVFLAALFTKRGNGATVLAALLTGFLVTGLLQNSVCKCWTQALFDKPFTLAGFWWLPIGTCISFLVCISGRPKPHSERPAAEPAAAQAV